MAFDESLQEHVEERMPEAHDPAVHQQKSIESAPDDQNPDHTRQSETQHPHSVPSPNGRVSEPNVKHSENNDTVENKRLRRRKLTAYQRVSHDLTNDERCMREITLGKRIGFYRFRGELGSGNFSQVKVAVHLLTKEKVAIKILDKTKLDQKTQRLLSREISNMEQLHHPNVIRLYEVVETLSKLFIVMEYANGGELFHKIQNEGKISESESQHIFAQIISAVKHIHDHKIVHRDIKAENVFIAGPVVKIGDFGFSNACAVDERLNTFCGSPPYAAPELFRDESYAGHYVDIWALGILLFFMVTGTMPFKAETVGKLKVRILAGTYVVPAHVSPECESLIRNILKAVPTDRFGLTQIMLSEWMNGHVFPEPHSPIHPLPSGSSSNIKEEHVEVRQALETLGITDDHIKESRSKDARSSINGTYRIMLHKIQKKNSEPTPSSDEMKQNGSVSVPEKKKLPEGQSLRVCVHYYSSENN